MNTPSWLQQILERPEVTDICLNGAGSVYIDRGQGREPYPASSCPGPSWSESELREWVLTQLSLAGKSWDAKHPFVDAILSSTGHRLHVAFPPIAPGSILVSLRKLPKPVEAPSSRWADSPLYLPLKEAVIRGDSVILSGSTGSGKTTLASDLLSEVPAPERVIALEDTPELAPRHAHFLSLTSRPPNADGYGEVTVRALLKQTLRMRPDRIILGECRGAEVLDLLQALNTGHRGSLATLHANSPRDALRRIELLCHLASTGLPHSVVRELIACGIQWIAQVKRTGDRRAITELWKVEGREGDTILLRQFTPT